MKKIFLALLIICIAVMGCMLVACDSGDSDNDNEASDRNEFDSNDETNEEDEKAKEPEMSVNEIIGNAIKEVLDAESYEATVELQHDVRVNINNYRNSISYDLAIKHNGAATSIEGTRNEYNIDISNNFYYDGEWLYAQMYGDYYKKQITGEKFRSLAFDYPDILCELSEDILNNAYVSENGNTIEVTIKLDRNTAPGVLSAPISFLAPDAEYTNIEIVPTMDTVLFLTIVDRKLSTYKMTFEFVEESYGRASLNFSESITFSNVGGNVEVQFPEGYQDYTEMTWDL